MRPAELLALGYFVCFCVLSLALRRTRAGWLTALGLSSAGAFVALAAPLIPARSGVDLRNWWLLLALPLAYWAPGPLAGHPNLRLEQWLHLVDEKLGVARTQVPQSAGLEIAYLLVSPMVPAALLAVTASGTDAVVSTFCQSMLLAVLPCYGLLPLIPTRPPRALLVPSAAAAAPESVVRQVNVRFLAAVGVGWNTIPSGHAAAATAAAALVWRSGSAFWPPFAIRAAGVALATVRGRYHYAADTLLGAGLGLAAAGLR
jgi:membrane-associated phospholipid phosphatase